MKVKDGFKYGLGLTLGKFAGSICTGIISKLVVKSAEKKEDEKKETEES